MGIIIVGLKGEGLGGGGWDERIRVGGWDKGDSRRGMGDKGKSCRWGWDGGGFGGLGDSGKSGRGGEEGGGSGSKVGKGGGDNELREMRKEEKSLFTET